MERDSVGVFTDRASRVYISQLVRSVSQAVSRGSTTYNNRMHLAFLLNHVWTKAVGIASCVRRLLIYSVQLTGWHQSDDRGGLPVGMVLELMFLQRDEAAFGEYQLHDVGKPIKRAIFK